MGTELGLDADAAMRWIIALAVAALLTLIVLLFSVALPRFWIIQNLIDHHTLVTRENLSGIMVVRAFNAQSFEETRFDRASASPIAPRVEVSVYLGRSWRVLSF